jgi:hypothetical protein
VLLDIAIIATVVLAVLALANRRLYRRATWRAMTTPLASIIGSGFLVLGPILDKAYGVYAPAAMAALCIGSYLYGYAIRYNIQVLDGHPARRPALANRLETAASWSLGFAYIISVTYYLNLFGAFAMSLTTGAHDESARLVTSAAFGAIVVVGWRRGFRMLERLEYVTVAAKLAIIAGFLVALAIYFSGTLAAGRVVLNPPELTGWAAWTLGFGLIVTVQGFETSRYLGDDYGAETRMRSMRWAQWLSSAIYMVYIVLLAYGFQASDIKLTETSIIDMMRQVAPLLPVLLVAAALAAQLSAAVADTSGSGGLFAELTQGRVTPRMGYLALGVIGLTLTWAANVFEIISMASRAFALYYALQAAIAAVTARNNGEPAWKWSLFVALGLLGAAIVAFGQPVES